MRVQACCANSSLKRSTSSWASFQRWERKCFSSQGSSSLSLFRSSSSICSLKAESIFEMEINSSHQRVFPFESGLALTSAFEGGNLSLAEAAGPLTFNLWLGKDHPSANYRTWFHFRLQTPESAVGQVVSFTIKNMSNQARLFKEGHMPAYSNCNDRQWKRIKIPISHKQIIAIPEGVELSFKHCLESTATEFAFCFPWTYHQHKQSLKQFQERANTLGLDAARDLLACSPSGYEVDVLSITSAHSKVSGKYGSLPLYHKKSIFVSARVHPGETPASHVMNGLMKALLERDAIANHILQEFVFYLVPMINPEGVARGHYRVSSYGENLNRHYEDPTPQRQPEIYAIKQFVTRLSQGGQFWGAIDLHAHASKKGIFLYGNHSPILNEQVQAMVLARLLALNSPYFQLDGCNFSAANMSAKDQGDQHSKEGSARVALYKATGNIRCYTLECNYNTGKTTNLLPSKPSKPESRFNEHVFNKAAILTKTGQTSAGAEPYTIPTFESIGLSIVQALVEQSGGPGAGRLRASLFRNMTNLKMNIAVSVMRTFPFRNYPKLRKLNDKLSYNDRNQDAFREVYEMLELTKEEILPVRPLVIEPSKRPVKAPTTRGKSVNPGPGAG